MPGPVGGTCPAGGPLPGTATSGRGGFGLMLFAFMYWIIWSGISARTSLASAACEILALPEYFPPRNSRNGTNCNGKEEIFQNGRIPVI